MVATDSIDLVPSQGSGDNAVPEHPEAQKRQRDAFGEEDTTQPGWHEREGISHTSNHDVLKYGCPLHEWTSVFIRGHVSFPDELIGYDENL
jgi:hypothetical protein